MLRPKKATVFEVIVTMAELREVVASLAETVKGLSEQIESLIKPQEVSIPVVVEAPANTSPAPAYPIPLEYRDIVDSVLNRSFEIEIAPRPDQPSFEFTILVPKKYSNAGQAHWEMYHADRRLKVITYADGVNGVRDYVEKVFNNLDQDTRTRVVMDRIK